MKEAVKMEMSEHRQQIVEQIKRHACAPEQYENGWDVIVETLSDPEIAVLTGKTASFAAARRRVSAYVRLGSGSTSKLSLSVAKALHEFQDAQLKEQSPYALRSDREVQELEREARKNENAELPELAKELESRGLRRLPIR